VLVGGAILPHPPIILPRYTDERRGRAADTVEAVRRASRWVADELRPDRLFVSSPHEGHGFEVPLAFLSDALGELPPVDRLLTSQPSYAWYAERGEQLRAAETGSERVAVIASGDCSHRLAEESPYGFHPLGPRLERALEEGIRSGSPEQLLSIDEETVREGAECGLRSFIFALAALRPSRCVLLSHEAPFGIGYLVATLHV
jgi:aromatic ring-opening dioxygenase LigB subunit